MNNKDLQHFKEKLIKEKTLLEEELNSIGKADPEHPNDWSASADDMDTDSADENETADKFEELEENKVILNKLEPQFIEVKDALERIENGKFGKCEECGKAIEKERLEANPSARTCKLHM